MVNWLWSIKTKVWRLNACYLFLSDPNNDETNEWENKIKVQIVLSSVIDKKCNKITFVSGNWHLKWSYFWNLRSSVCWFSPVLILIQNKEQCVLINICIFAFERIAVNSIAVNSIPNSLAGRKFAHNQRWQLC